MSGSDQPGNSPNLENYWSDMTTSERQAEAAPRPDPQAILQDFWKKRDDTRQASSSSQLSGQWPSGSADPTQGIDPKSIALNTPPHSQPELLPAPAPTQIENWVDQSVPSAQVTTSSSLQSPPSPSYAQNTASGNRIELDPVAVATLHGLGLEGLQQWSPNQTAKYLNNELISLGGEYSSEEVRIYLAPRIRRMIELDNARRRAGTDALPAGLFGRGQKRPHEEDEIAVSTSRQMQVNPPPQSEPPTPTATGSTQTLKV